MKESLELLLGAPVQLEELKLKPGRRSTFRASGPRGRAIVKVYRSGRAPTVAARLRSLEPGPAEPAVPRVRAVWPCLRAVVLSEVDGRPLREAALAGETAACARVGAALARWHGFWARRAPAAVLRPHTPARELELLHARFGGATAAVRWRVEEALERLPPVRWSPETVVHRDLYEEQVLLGTTVGLIDLDDAALGPGELDLGNLCAHLDLLGRRSGLAPEPWVGALVEAYARVRPLDRRLLDRCRALAALRLACIHELPELASPELLVPAAG